MRSQLVDGALSQLLYVSTAIGTQTQPNSSPFGSLAVCFLASAANAAAPSVVPASDMMLDVRDVTVKSSAAGFPIPSH